MARDLYKYFRVEAKDIVEQLSRGVLALEDGKGSKESVAQMLRLAHTLKGAAHVVKQAGIARLAHQMEDGLLPYAEGQSLPASSAKQLLHQVDTIAAQLAELGSDQPQPAARGESAPAVPVPAIDEAFETLRIDISEMDTLLSGVNEMGVQLGGLKTKLSALEEAAALSGVLAGYVSPHAGVSAMRNAAAMGKAKSLAEDLTSLAKSVHTGLANGVEQIQRELAQVRDLATQLRLVPASVLFVPLQRAVRNAAESLGKEVEFEATGGEHRLDAHVLAAARDILLHLVRNAVAHGIEPASQRLAAGKPNSGKVSLRVERRGNRVAFVCADDGRGFDVEALRRAAIARNLIPAYEAANLQDTEVIRRIFRGGVSTTGTADELSGRGIGLDVVRETAARLKADVNVDTEPGRGSRVEICVPVSLLSLDALTVEGDGVVAALPLDAVQRTVRLEPGELVRALAEEAMLFDGKAIPFVRLERLLNGKRGAPWEPSATRHPNSRGMGAAVVVRSGQELAAVGVDRLLDTGAVVLRPIPAFAGVDPVIAGASLDAEGNPQLVLDPAALISAASRQSAVAPDTPPPPKPLLLVIDDSLTSRSLQQSILESAGFAVEVASSAEEALERCRERSYDLFLVDVEMPGMDGFAFIAHTREDPALRAVPSILVTSRSSEQDRRRGQEVGARAYMAKSDFDQGVLLRTIRQLMGQV